MSSGHSETASIAAMKGGDQSAADALVQRYYEKLVRYAEGVYGHKFRGVSHAAEGPEEAANDALWTLWKHAAEFEKLTDRNDLWKLLVVLTIRKVYRQRQRALRQKRGGGDVQDQAPDDLDKLVSDFPAPDAAAEFEDTLRAALEILNPELRRIAQMWLDGKSTLETANDLGTTECTVYRKRDDIKAICKEELELNTFIDDLAEPKACAELREICRAMMPILDPEPKRVAELWLEDKSPAEIADVLGMPRRDAYRNLAAINKTGSE